MTDVKIKMHGKVNNIIGVLQEAGFEAYAVGGCIRDSLLGRTPNDWDITTSAKPMEVKALFSHTIDTGIQHGTVTILLDREGFEVTTYRIDGEYEDGRHPKEVSFTGSLEEDLKRRDFTINALAYNETAGLIDIFEGQKDLKDGIIRCVGNAEERFTEDALRMLRAIRFSAQLGYRIEENTLTAIHKLAGNLEKISAERIQTELLKLMVSPHPDYLRTAYECGVTKVFFPEFNLANNAQNLNFPGWKAFDNGRNRFAIINDYLEGAMKPFRQLQYDYYRTGLDEMATNVERGRGNVTTALETGLKKCHEDRPLSMLPQIWTDYKRDELTNIYKGKGTQKEKETVYDILFSINASQNSAWEKIKE